MSAFELFSHFTTKLASMRNLQSRLEHYEDSFALKKYRLGEISIQDAMTLHKNIVKKFYKYYDNGQSGVWFENELRLFVWILVGFMEIYKKNIRSIDAQDWQFFSHILYVKQPSLFEYQARIIFDYSLCLRKWENQEDNLLTKIVLASKKIKWNEIAKGLFLSSEKIFTRTSKQCRERWLNHLDPCKSKDSWTLQQCQVLIKAVMEKGKKWASLVKTLQGKRSEHSIKNRFNSIFLRQQKMEPQLNEKEICLVLLERIDKILATNLISDEDEHLFGECFKTLKELQNQNEQIFQNQDQDLLTKNISPSPSGSTEVQLTWNYDDFLMQPNQFLFGVQMMGNSPTLAKKTSKGQKGKGNNTVLEDYFFEEDSMAELQQIKLVIRESELDR